MDFRPEQTRTTRVTAPGVRGNGDILHFLLAATSR